MPSLFISSREHKIFTDRKRKVLRKRIPNGEVAFSVVFLVVVVAMGLWFAMKKDDYDPAERDISMAIMEEGAVVDTLYRSPLKPWVDPAAATMAAPGASPDLTPFPPAILDGGWQPSSRLQHFDEENLYEKINGAADQFFQFGFVQMHYLSLASPDTVYGVAIEMYDMGTLPNALGIFAAQRDSSQEVVNEAGAYIYPTAIGAIGIAGPYYFKIAGNAEAAPVKEKAQQMVQVLGQMGSQSGAFPKPFQFLTDDLKVPFDGIMFEKSDVFQYAFATEFWFGKAGSDPSFRYFLHEAGTTEEATGLYNQLLENFLFDYDEVSRSESSIVLKHKFLDTFLALGQSETVVFGVDGAPDTAALESSMAAISGAMNGKVDGEEEETYPAS